MKNKKLILAVSLLMLASAFSSCSSDKTSEPDNVSVIVNNNSSETEIAETTEIKNLQQDAEDAYTPVVGGTDANGYIVTALPVTDKKGANVTDKSGSAVTEIAVVDTNGSVVTDTNGNNAKPQMPVVTINIYDDDPADEIENDFSEENTPGTTGILWITSLTKNETKIEDGVPVNKLKLVGTEGTGELFTVKIKINENAPDGNYEINFGRNNSSNKGSFCGDNDYNYDVNYVPAVITVGNAQPAQPASPNGVSCELSSASASAGDTITLTCNLTGAPGLAAFNTYLNYDPNVITIESIDQGSLIQGKGEFMAM